MSGVKAFVAEILEETELDGQQKKGVFDEENEIVYERAHVLFGLILRLLCGRANITQDYLEEQGKAYRDVLIAEGKLPPKYPVGSLDQEAISRVWKGERLPSSRPQVGIWLDVIENTFNSEKYLEIRKKYKLPVYDLPHDLKVDMYHLAGFGAPDEIVASYKRRLSMIKKGALPRFWNNSKKRAFREKTDELIN